MKKLIAFFLVTFAFLVLVSPALADDEVRNLVVDLKAILLQVGDALGFGGFKICNARLEQQIQEITAEQIIAFGGPIAPAERHVQIFLHELDQKANILH